MGGLGKTQIADEFSIRRKRSYDAVFWLAADEAVDLDEAFARIAISLGLLGRDEAKDRVLSKNAVLNFLSKPYKVPREEQDQADEKDLPNWLMVFDNVNDPSLLRCYTPMDGPGSVLITSRDQFAKQYLGTNSGLDLEPLYIEDADELIQKLTYRSQSSEEKMSSHALAQRLGSLPIAIVHIAGVMNGKYLTFQECMNSYEDGSATRNTGELALAQSGPYAQTVTTVWALHELPPPSLTLLQVLSLLVPDKVSETLLQHGEGHMSLESYPGAKDLVEVRSRLLKASLIKRNLRKGTLSIHQVVQDIVLQEMSPVTFEAVFEVAVKLLAAHWTEDRVWAFGHRLHDWEIADKVVPHIIRVANLFQKRDTSLKPSIAREFVALINRASNHLMERGTNWKESLALAEFSLNICKPLQEEMGELYADILMTLSSAYHCLGDALRGPHYAMAHFEQRIKVEDAKGDDKDDGFRGMAYTELALARLMTNDYEEAISLARRGWGILEQTPEFLRDEYYPHWAIYHHAWGLIGLGRGLEALPMLKRMLEWRQRHYGIDDTESMN